MITNRRSPNLLDFARTLGRQVHDLVFPPQCVACDAIGAWLCPSCAQSVEPVGDLICRRCGRAQTAATDSCPFCIDSRAFKLSQVRAAAFHQAPLRQAIHMFKYEGCTELSTALAGYLVAAYAKPCWIPPSATVDLVVPVPLHEERRAERGFNQSELLAADLCRSVGLQIDRQSLRRIRHTPHQVGLDAASRRQNVADAFKASTAVVGKHLLLIDDVYTTGATLCACADAALDAGAVAVSALTLAAPHPHR
jgi:ComF family protein